jgi:hypothetical protein
MVAFSLIDGGNKSTRRKLPICSKSMVIVVADFGDILTKAISTIKKEVFGM